jgi:ribosomal protein L16 Arg81 hydroxylase
MITEVNCETGEVITREPNAEELAQAAIDQKRTEDEVAELNAKEATRKAVLDKLGLSADEVAALLG